MFRKKEKKDSQGKGKKYSVGKKIGIAFGLFILINLLGFTFLIFGKGPRGDSIDQLRARVLGEETRFAPLERKEGLSMSEHYRAPIVIFGGNVSLPDSLGEVPPKVQQVKSELLTTKNQEEIKLLVSWKTNKPTKSTVEYGRNAQKAEKNIQEEKYGYTHSVVLPSLDAATAYTYKIKARDKWGNEGESDKFAFYTGAPAVSLIDLLLGALRDVFSWAIKK